MNIIDNKTHLQKQLVLAKHNAKQYENLLDQSSHHASLDEQLEECQISIHHKKTFMKEAKFEEKQKLEAQIELLEVRQKALKTAIENANHGKNIEILVRQLNIARSNVKSINDRLDRLNHKNPNLHQQAMEVINLFNYNQ
jgi:hypothetical protein